jgi:hypothetical protein
MSKDTLTFRRWGTEVKQRFCPNKECKTNKKKDALGRTDLRFYRIGMSEIGSRDNENHYCRFCGGHYEGKRGSKKLKFIGKKEWEEAVEKWWKEF